MLSIDKESVGVRILTSETHPDRPPDEEIAEVSVAEALELAVGLHRAGNVQVAEVLYLRILEAVPEHPDALNFLGMLASFKGERDLAIDLISRSLAADPSVGDRYNNLGNVLLAAERIDEAVAAYEKALSLAPESPTTYCNLGVIYAAQRRFEEAERIYSRALEIDPNNAAALANFGNLCGKRGDMQKALEYHIRAVKLRPSDTRSWKFLGTAYAALGRLEEAAAVYKEWLANDPGSPAARHLLAACSGTAVPERAPDDYVEQGFDAFAATFESHLAKLEYRAPQLVERAIKEAGVKPRQSLGVLDAGCGTGLCGPFLKSYAKKLVGVDLSLGMLGQARGRGLYHELVKAELTAYLREHEAMFDLIVSADTLCYFGTLDEVFRAAAGSLRSDGLLIFTVERAQAADAPQGHRINPHGRFSHTREYVDRALEQAGFGERLFGEETLRMEAAAPVAGLLVTARRSHANGGE